VFIGRGVALDVGVAVAEVADGVGAPPGPGSGGDPGDGLAGRARIEGDAGDDDPGVRAAGVDGDPLPRAGLAPGLKLSGDLGGLELPDLVEEIGDRA
jgi:hypothetical protein